MGNQGGVSQTPTIIGSNYTPNIVYSPNIVASSQLAGGEQGYSTPGGQIYRGSQLPPEVTRFLPAYGSSGVPSQQVQQLYTPNPVQANLSTVAGVKAVPIPNVSNSPILPQSQGIAQAQLMRQTLQQQIALLSTNQKNVQNAVNQLQGDKGDLDQQIRDYNLKVADLQASIYRGQISAVGYQQTVKNLNELKSQLDSQIQSYNQRADFLQSRVNALTSFQQVVNDRIQKENPSTQVTPTFVINNDGKVSQTSGKPDLAQQRFLQQQVDEGIPTPISNRPSAQTQIALFMGLNRSNIPSNQEQVVSQNVSFFKEGTKGIVQTGLTVLGVPSDIRSKAVKASGYTGAGVGFAVGELTGFPTILYQKGFEKTVPKFELLKNPIYERKQELEKTKYGQFIEQQRIINQILTGQTGVIGISKIFFPETTKVFTGETPVISRKELKGEFGQLGAFTAFEVPFRGIKALSEATTKVIPRISESPEIILTNQKNPSIIEFESIKSTERQVSNIFGTKRFEDITKQTGELILEEKAKPLIGIISQELQAPELLSQKKPIPIISNVETRSIELKPENPLFGLSLTEPTGFQKTTYQRLIETQQTPESLFSGLNKTFEGIKGINKTPLIGLTSLQEQKAYNVSREIPFENIGFEERKVPFPQAYSFFEKNVPEKLVSVFPEGEKAQFVFSSEKTNEILKISDQQSVNERFQLSLIGKEESKNLVFFKGVTSDLEKPSISIISGKIEKQKVLEDVFRGGKIQGGKTTSLNIFQKQEQVPKVLTIPKVTSKAIEKVVESKEPQKTVFISAFETQFKIPLSELTQKRNKAIGIFTEEEEFKPVLRFGEIPSLRNISEERIKQVEQVKNSSLIRSIDLLKPKTKKSEKLEETSKIRNIQSIFTELAPKTSLKDLEAVSLIPKSITRTTTLPKTEELTLKIPEFPTPKPIIPIPTNKPNYNFNIPISRQVIPKVRGYKAFLKISKTGEKARFIPITSRAVPFETAFTLGELAVLRGKYAIKRTFRLEESGQIEPENTLKPNYNLVYGKKGVLGTFVEYARTAISSPEAQRALRQGKIQKKINKQLNLTNAFNYNNFFKKGKKK